MRAALVTLCLASGGCAALFGVDDTTLRTDVDGGAPDALPDAGPGFTVGLSSKVWVVRGHSIDLSVTVTGASFPVEVSLTHLSAGLSADTLTIDAGASTGTLHLSAAAGAALGPQQVTLHATGGGGTLDQPQRVVVADPTGTLDASFGGTGMVTGMCAQGCIIGSIVSLSDGRLIIGGIDGAGNWLVNRMTVAGGVDATLDTTIGLGSARGLAVTPSGQLLVAGYVRNGTTTTAGHVVRLDDRLAVDTSFGDAGHFTSPLLDDADGVGLQPDGKIVFSGSSGGSGVVCRIDAGGRAYDPAFQTGVCAMPSSTSANLIAVSVAGDGTLLAAGTMYPTNGTELYVASLTANGGPTSGFGTNGVALLQPESHATLYALGRSQGLPLVAGYAYDITSQSPYLLARLTAAGGVDPSFGGGVISGNFFGGPTSIYQAALEQSDGRVLAAGYGLDAQSKSYGVVARYGSDGIPDASLGGGGLLKLPEGTRLYAMTLDPDGRIVVAGFRNGVGGMVARIWP